MLRLDRPKLLAVSGLSDDFQQRAFTEVRQFFEADESVKLSADIRLSPYYRGWSRATDLGKSPPVNAHGEPKFAQVPDHLSCIIVPESRLTNFGTPPTCAGDRGFPVCVRPGTSGAVR